MTRTMCAALVLSGTAIVGAAAALQTVAEVGSRKLTLDDVKAGLQEMRQQGPQQVMRSLTPDGRQSVLNAIVARELMAQAAQRDGLASDPAIAAEIERATALILSQHYAKRTLAAADVSDARLRAYYDEHKAQFDSKGRVKARHILAKSREDADAVRAELGRGGDFVALARERSVDPYTRDKGGELGWIERGVMVKAFEDPLFAVPAGETAVIESPQGFHVVRVDEVQQPVTPAFESVRHLVAERVRIAHLARVQEELKKHIPVKTYPEALKALER